MMVYILIALIWNRPLMEKPDSGVIQIEFDTMKKCEDAQQSIRNSFNTSTMKCIIVRR